MIDLISECWAIDMDYDEYVELCLKNNETPLSKYSYWSEFDKWNDMLAEYVGRRRE